MTFGLTLIAVIYLCNPAEVFHYIRVVQSWSVHDLVGKRKSTNRALYANDDLVCMYMCMAVQG